MISIDALESVAKSATPGPWRVGDHASIVESPCPCCGLIANCALYGVETGDKKEDSERHYNSAYLALCSPETLLALIACVRAAKNYADHNFGMQVQGGSKDIWDARKKSVDDLKESLLPFTTEPKEG